jgi:hypothetical protein
MRFKSWPDRAREGTRRPGIPGYFWNG